MNTEARFLLAIGLMLVVLVGTNLLFPPIPPEEPALDSIPGMTVPDETGAPGEQVPVGAGDPAIPEGLVTAEEPAVDSVELTDPEVEETLVTVEGPLYRFTFSNLGAQVVSAELPGFDRLDRPGVLELLPAGSEGALGHRLLVGSDTVDLESTAFETEPAAGLTLSEGGGRQTLRFSYRHPTLPFGFDVSYEFDPDSYEIGVRGSVTGLDRPVLLTDLGDGVEYSEADSVGESRSMAFVGHHVQDGIRSTVESGADFGVREGPFLWVAFRSKFFVIAQLAGRVGVEPTETDYFGGLIVEESPLEERVSLSTAQAVGMDGSFHYRLYMGPQEYGRLQSLGGQMQEVNPYGWRFMRPIVRPFVSIITTILSYFHNQLNIGYGWVLMLFGVLMRVVLWPLNQKAMRSQLKNMAVQPLLKEIQTKHKDNPERLQKEMLKLHKEHGFNPLGGCLPMLLPWPVLIALFFVFQNTIEFRGVPFLWLPDLSAPDPLYLLPAFLGLSMFLMQWVSMRSIDEVNPQMKMMMWFMPIMMVFIFFRLASGLNLYYATVNIATIPQQIWINKERQKVRGANAARAAAKAAAESGKKG